MECIREITRTVDWIPTLKDFVIILLSAITIFSSYIQHKKTKRTEWIKEFRSIIAKIISTASSQIEKNDIGYYKEVIEQFSLVSLYLNSNNPTHSKLLSDLKTLNNDLKDFKDGKKESGEVSKTITTVITTSRKIIKEENDKIL